MNTHLKLEKSPVKDYVPRAEVLFMTLTNWLPARHFNRKITHKNLLVIKLQNKPASRLDTPEAYRRHNFSFISAPIHCFTCITEQVLIIQS